MKKSILCISFLLTVSGFLISSCGGGGGSTTPTARFETQMLDVEPRYYISYSGSPDGSLPTGVTQMVLNFEGSGGSYVAKVSESYFDEGDNFVSSTYKYFNCDLNVDGTLTCTNYLDSSNIIEFTCSDDVSTHLKVDGVDQSSDSWQEEWYKSKPSGWMPSYTFNSQMLYHLNYFGGNYTVRTSLVKDGVAISPTEIVSANWTMSNGSAVTTDLSVPINDNYVLADCTGSTCVWENITKNGYRFEAGILPVFPDDFIVRVDVVGGGYVETAIRFDQDYVIPDIPILMPASWEANGDLTLSWINPVGEVNWDKVNRLRISVFSSTPGGLVGSVWVSPSVETVTLPAALVAEMEAIGSGSIGRWSVQARTYTTSNPTNEEIARSYSTMQVLP